MLGLYLRGAAAIPGAAAFFAATRGRQPAAGEPADSYADDGAHDDGFEVHVRRMTTW